MSSWPPAQVLADWLLLPWVFGSSLWLPQPAFQETLRPVPASGNQSSALAQGLGGRARMFLVPKSSTLTKGPDAALGTHTNFPPSRSETQAQAWTLF